MAGTAVGVVPPLLVRTLVDDVLKGEGGMPLLALLVAALVGLSLAGVLLTIVRGRLAARVGSKVVHEIRFDLYQAIQRLTLRRYDKSQTGSLISRLTHDTERVNFFLIEVGAYFVPELLLLVGILVMIFWLNWQLALLVLIPAPAVLLATAWFYRRLRRLYHRYWQRRAIMTARATDSISGIRVVKAFSQEPREIDEFRWRSSSFADSAATAEAMWATGAPIIHFLMGTGTFMVWYFGGRALLRGEPGMTPGTLMAFLHYLALFYGPLRMLTGFSDFMNRALTAAQRLFEITDAEQEVYEAPDAQPVPDPKGGLSLQNVHFSYTKDKPVLKGLTLEVRPGEMIGLVGKSGAGKTTMCNLICRFYDVDEGSICLDGMDLRQLRLRGLRRHIGIVPQESFLFNGSIAENIGYASPETTRADIIRAAITANAHGFIMRLPDGYDTRVGERGARLSGGEKQRIAIARAYCTIRRCSFWTRPPPRWIPRRRRSSRRPCPGW